MRTENNDLLVALQRGIPIVRRPFAELGETLELSEAEVLGTLRALFDENRVRRFGAVFDVRRLGYLSALCAVDVPQAEVETRAAALTPYTGITHSYVRGWPPELPRDTPGAGGGVHVPNLWFTLARLDGLFQQEMAEIEAAMAPHRILVLPAIRRFKIDVVFDPSRRNRAEVFPGIEKRAITPDVTGEDLSFRDFSARDKAIVRAMQGNLLLSATPFDEVAAQLGCDMDELMHTLRDWAATGILRRIGVILRHRTMSFKANAMCVWKVPADRALEAGRMLASFPQVTHCYQRPRDPDFDFDLYAMIHTAAWPTTIELFGELQHAAGLANGRVLCSLREFKKSSPKYFSEDEDDRGL
jgi:DNA-binding Lrp family transcriptional regulator